MTIAIKQIQECSSRIADTRVQAAHLKTQFNTEGHSGSISHQALGEIISGSSKGFSKKSKSNNLQILKFSTIDTPLGSMVAIGDDNTLYLLEFTDQRKLEDNIKTLKVKLNATIVPEKARTIALIEDELKAYFNGTLIKFTTPISPLGSPFQMSAWRQLECITYGHTQTYKAQAVTIRRPLAYRAVANANGANLLAIIIPCHRVINGNGNIGGYGGGSERKQWLIEHEKKYVQ